LPYIFDGREQVFQEIGAPLCGLFPFIVMSCPGVPAFQAAREDLDAPGRTIIVDPDPLEVRVESAALVPTMERLPVCPNTDAVPHE
jgi:hypothetical protein